MISEHLLTLNYFQLQKSHVMTARFSRLCRRSLREDAVKSSGFTTEIPKEPTAIPVFLSFS
jgi:hypothetical protein